MSSNLLFLRTLTQTSSHSNNKLQTFGREADCSLGLKELDANEPPDATVKYAWVTP